MSSKFSIKVRVYYEDTDAGGVVFYANYLKFMERARTEWLRDFGIEQDELLTTEGLVFAVSSLQMDYLKPAQFNDLLEISVAVKRIGKASVRVYQEVTRDTELLNRADVKLACVDKETFKPQRIPQRIIDCVETG